MTAEDISIALHARLNYGKFHPVVFSNMIILDSPWESDVISVSDCYYWTEYEIKVSLADYRADFKKVLSGYQKDSPTKHELYASGDPISRNFWGTTEVSKPAQFYFVTPAGLLDGVDIPEHCGHMEFHEGEDWPFKRMSLTRKAPRLKKASQLSMKQLYNLTGKATAKSHTYRSVLNSREI